MFGVLSVKIQTHPPALPLVDLIRLGSPCTMQRGTSYSYVPCPCMHAETSMQDGKRATSEVLKYRLDG